MRIVLWVVHPHTYHSLQPDMVILLLWPFNDVLHIHCFPSNDCWILQYVGKGTSRLCMLLLIITVFKLLRYLSSGDCLSVTGLLGCSWWPKRGRTSISSKVALQQHLKHHHFFAKQQIAIVMQRNTTTREANPPGSDWGDKVGGGREGSGMRPHPSKIFRTLASLKFAGLAASAAAR